MRTFYSFLLSLFFVSVSAQTSISDTLRIMFVGDIMNHGPQIKAAYDAKSKDYHYDENFQFLLPIFSQADWVIGNLETTLGVKPYAGYPQFSAPPALARDCQQAGVNVLATANNHSCDKRKKGIINTLDVLDTLQIKHFGTYRSQKERDSLTPLILQSKGFSIALLNYTYGTNGLPVPYPTKVNIIDKKQIKADIEKSKLLHPDAIIVFLHWGTQYKSKPNGYQKDLVKFLHKQGINIIIGSHPHVLQPIEYKNDTLNKRQELTVYSLGNFISNQRTYPRDGSMILRFEITRDIEGNLRILPPKTVPLWVYKYNKKKKRHYEILPVEDFIYSPNFFKRNADYQKMMRYYKYYDEIIGKDFAKK